MKFLQKLFVFTFVITNQFIGADLPQPYTAIRNLPATPYYVQDAYTYSSLISSHNAAVIVDVDSEDGGVARFIAQQASNLPSVTTIYSISSWANYPSKKHLYQRFLSNVIQENTANLIIPIRMNSLEAAAALNITADFISLVGANDGDVIYHDILAWYSHLSDNGVICGNNWYESSVEMGVTKAAQYLGVNLKINNNVWYILKHQ